ncbi:MULTISPECIES: pirin family protein [Porphyromonadaceae]|jgi:quercetin 2,3-dioxygenase|uniref:Pirin n=1 Tax=Sanguibacteroides justesenii TaxID=1547597 RepID=A0A0C3RG93_9PORP|nr:MULTISPECIES: pirin family protein [Porphyromonadaceae]KIO44449.1 pirin [Sanguibacteroides justesenii]KIO45295.1 pirin [Sanguibacteroides justesenii]MCR9011250.1 pirin family protein [Gabonibacter chumensis]PXZ44584.1 pirin family protein [Sanguibacteroides justesenii]
MKTILHKAATRGFFDHGWLKTHHTFSFADYYDPERINFGALRVLNDDKIAGGTGFGLHPHQNMEVVSIPLKGALEHKDSLGHASVIKEGEIQAMSAGTGIRHSEYNKNNNTPAEFLQIWVIPDRMNVSPRYENAVIADLLKKNEITEIVSPYPGDGKGLWIYQQAWFSIGELEKNTLQGYKLKSPNSLGVYAFLIEGKATVAGKELEKRDGLGIYDTESFEIKANEYTKILLIEVPPYS